MEHPRLDEGDDAPTAGTILCLPPLKDDGLKAPPGRWRRRSRYGQGGVPISFVRVRSARVLFAPAPWKSALMVLPWTVDTAERGCEQSPPWSTLNEQTALRYRRGGSRVIKAALPRGLVQRVNSERPLQGVSFSCRRPAKECTCQETEAKK